MGHGHFRRSSPPAAGLALPVAPPHTCDVDADRPHLKRRRVSFGYRLRLPTLLATTRLGPDPATTNGHMKPALSAVATTIALALGGCGLEAARPTILVQNNSD